MNKKCIECNEKENCDTCPLIWNNDVDYKNGDENSNEYLDYKENENFEDNFSQGEADRRDMDEAFSRGEI